MKQEIWNDCVPIEFNEVGISIKKETKRKLEKIGSMNSTYSDVIEDILNHCDECDRFVENKN